MHTYIHSYPRSAPGGRQAVQQPGAGHLHGGRVRGSRYILYHIIIHTFIMCYYIDLTILSGAGHLHGCRVRGCYRYTDVIIGIAIS